jgi:protein-disulfide isomerase
MKISTRGGNHRSEIARGIGTISTALALLSLACANAIEPAATEKEAAVAVVNGKGISLSTVDEQIRNELFEREFGANGGGAKLHQARQDAISTLVGEILLEKAAAAAQETPEQWLEAKISAKGPVTDEEVEIFFEENKERMGPGAALESLSTRIRSYLEHNRRETIYRDLLAEATIEVTLPRDRVEIAASGPSTGPENAPVTIVEFSDFQCPYCSKAADVMKEVIARYPNEVRLVYRHLPLDFHANAHGSAKASICADEQDRFWDYHDLLFANQRALEREKLMEYAVQLELDMTRFEACMTSARNDSIVAEDLAAAGAVGASGTPAFFVNGIMLSGAQPFDVFETLIEEELRR